MSLATDLFTRALQHSPTAAMIFGRDSSADRIVFVNPAFEELTGYAAADMSTTGLAQLHGAETDALSISRLQAAVATGSELRLTMLSYRKDGSSFWNHLHIVPLRDASGVPAHFMGMMTDITAERLVVQRLEHRAHHDALTGLPNRHMLLDRLNLQIAHAQQNHKPFALVLLDVNHFKQINDTLGHDFGDQLLASMGTRLKHCVRSGDTVSRYGGDEFVLLLHADSRDLGFEDIRSRIDSCLQGPVLVGGYEISISCSVGVSVYPVDGLDQPTLFRKADQDMYADKSRRRGAADFRTSSPRESTVWQPASACSLPLRGGSSALPA